MNALNRTPNTYHIHSYPIIIIFIIVIIIDLSFDATVSINYGYASIFPALTLINLHHWINFMPNESMAPITDNGISSFLHFTDNNNKW